MQAVSEPPTISDHGIGNNVGGREHYFAFHAPLTVYDASEQLLPRIAEKIPGLSDGDWTLLPDGGMEVTWKLRPNAVWHDGTPLSAEDFVFGFQVVKDPASGGGRKSLRGGRSYWVNAPIATSNPHSTGFSPPTRTAGASPSKP